MHQPQFTRTKNTNHENNTDSAKPTTSTRNLHTKNPKNFEKHCTTDAVMQMPVYTLLRINCSRPFSARGKISTGRRDRAEKLYQTIETKALRSSLSFSNFHHAIRARRGEISGLRANRGPFISREGNKRLV